MLTDYAVAHMRLIQIDRRFEAVIQRVKAKRWQIDAARIEGKYQRESFPMCLRLFDVYFPRNNSPRR